jgi:type I restriction enzyme, R subunit
MQLSPPVPPERLDVVRGQPVLHGPDGVVGERGVFLRPELEEVMAGRVGVDADRNARETVLIGTYDDQLRKTEEAIAKLLEITPTAHSVDDLPDEEATTVFVKAFRELLRARNVLASYSEFDPAHLPMSEQDFEDFKGKYLDIAQKAKGDGEDEPDEPLAGIDFELELLRRDEINVSYILALLISLRATATEAGAGSAKARAQRARIFELLQSEVQLRGKRALIEAFIDQRMPMLGPDDDLKDAFARFWSEEREKAFGELCAREKLDPEAVMGLVQAMVFSGKKPLGEQVVAAMDVKPGILSRRSSVERVTKAIEDLIETFDEGIGVLDD